MNSALTAAIIKANQTLKGRSFVIILSGHEKSVLRHLRLEGHSVEHTQLNSIFALAVHISARRGVAVAAATYSPLDDTAPAPSLRMTCSCSISEIEVRVLHLSCCGPL